MSAWAARGCPVFPAIARFCPPSALASGSAASSNGTLAVLGAVGDGAGLASMPDSTRYATGQFRTFGRQLAKYGRDAKAGATGRIRRDGSGRDLGYPPEHAPTEPDEVRR